MTATLRLGTRGSALALAQSSTVAAEITRRTGRRIELVTVATHGDVSDAPLASMGGTGVFATALREALIAGECDFVVHSYKDLPTAPHPGLVVAAVPAREDPRDAFVSQGGATLSALAPGSRVGTGSPRRAAQVMFVRPDLEVGDIRGNVDTRLAKVRSGEYDAVVLAAAGLARLGLLSGATEVFPLDTWPTAAGQGALAIEAREGEDDAALRLLLREVEDDEARLTASAERAVLAGLEAGCAAPVGITASLAAGEITLTAAVYELSGQRSVVRSVAGHVARVADLAAELVAALFDAGASELAPLGKAT